MRCRGRKKNVNPVVTPYDTYRALKSPMKALESLTFQFLFSAKHEINFVGIKKTHFFEMGNRCHDMCSSDVYAHLRIKEKRREDRKRKITVIASEKFWRKLSVAFLPSLSRKMITNSFLLFPFLLHRMGEENLFLGAPFLAFGSPLSSPRSF